MAVTRASIEGTVSSFAIRTVPPERAVSSLADDVLAGFERQPRQLSPKYFYDEHGSDLFDRICDTPEYYPMRTEAAILDQYGSDIIAAIRPDHIVELGAGTSRKTEALLTACEHADLDVTYWPYDVCESVLHQTGERLLNKYPWLQVEALVGDYTAGLAHLPRPEGRCLYVFLGGTLGNFEPGPGQALLSDIRRQMVPGDGLLLGTDRVKERATLEAAYDDAAGATAEFNRNILRVINRELDADFAPEAFRHEAIFNPEASRMEMSLRALEPQTVTVGRLERTYEIARGEPIFTEISHKFTAESLRRELVGAGMKVETEWLDRDGYFSVTLVRAESW